jgi:hypothetical protein
LRSFSVKFSSGCRSAFRRSVRRFDPGEEEQMTPQTGMAQTLMGQTVLLAFRIAFVWAAGLLLAVAVRAALPDKLGFNLFGKHSALFVPFSRVGFWTCVLAAVTVTALVVFRAMIVDINSGSVR